MRVPAFLAALALVFGFAAAPAKAAEIIWFYKAELIFADLPVMEGTPLEGFFAFDDETPGTALGGGDVKRYGGAITLFVAQLPDAPPVVGGGDLGNPNGILIVNDSTGGSAPPFTIPENSDAFVGSVVTNVFGMPITMLFGLFDDTPEDGADWLTSSALFSAVPNLADLNGAFVVLTNQRFGPPGDDDEEDPETFALVFRITALSDQPFAVPAPAPLLLLLSGFAGLALLRRRG